MATALVAEEINGGGCGGSNERRRRLTLTAVVHGGGDGRWRQRLTSTAVARDRSYGDSGGDDESRWRRLEINDSVSGNGQSGFR